MPYLYGVQETKHFMNKGDKIDVLGLGYVRYVDHLGSDTRVVEAARQSYASPSKGYEADMKLLSYLYKNQHSSPIEQCNITFEIKLPIFVMRQVTRHRTFRLNEMSARYTLMPDEMFMPKLWRRPDPQNKQSSYVDSSDTEAWHEANSEITEHSFRTSYDTYKNLLERGVAREQARIVLPVAMFTQFYLNVDLRNLLHFLELRLGKGAQEEITEVAQAIYNVAKEFFPETIKLFDTYKVVMVPRK